MNIKEMNKEQLDNLYEEHLVFDFPKEELKSLAMLQSYMDKGQYTVYGMYEEDELLAYAMFVHLEGHNISLLDYFACNRNKRSCGYGTKMLGMLQKAADVDGFIIEVESVRTAANEEEVALRERRIAFYERNGLRRTNIRTCVYGVEFEILYLPIGLNIDDGLLYEQIEKIYIQMFTKENFDKHITMERIH